MKLFLQLILLSLFNNSVHACFIGSYPQNRHVFDIQVNAESQLRVEQKLCDIKDLSDILYEYYSNSDKSEIYNYSGASFQSINKKILLEKINQYKEKSIYYYDNTHSIKYYLNIYKQNLYLINLLKVENIKVLNFQEVIRIKQKAKTPYKTYIAVLTAIKTTINRIRNEKALALFNMTYRKIVVNQKSKRMRQYLFILKVLVPERIQEYRIRN